MTSQNVKTSTNDFWFSIRYTPDAPSGLPPLFQAARTCTYSDSDGVWLVALWDHPDVERPANCILRVRHEHVVECRPHESMTEAARHAFG